jgi:hypothetical protein
MLLVMAHGLFDSLARQREAKETFYFHFRKGLASLIELFKEDTDMATKKHTVKGQEAIFALGTRHEKVHPSLATITRQPLAIPVKGQAKAAKKKFISDLLQGAGPKGITWPAIRQALVTEYGQAPKKRAILYALLGGVSWHKSIGERGIVTYHLGKARKAK